MHCASPDTHTQRTIHGVPFSFGAEDALRLGSQGSIAVVGWETRDSKLAEEAFFFREAQRRGLLHLVLGKGHSSFASRAPDPGMPPDPAEQSQVGLVHAAGAEAAGGEPEPEGDQRAGLPWFLDWVLDCLRVDRVCRRRTGPSHT